MLFVFFMISIFDANINMPLVLFTAMGINLQALVSESLLPH